MIWFITVGSQSVNIWWSICPRVGSCVRYWCLFGIGNKALLLEVHHVLQKCSSDFGTCCCHCQPLLSFWLDKTQPNHRHKKSPWLCTFKEPFTHHETLCGFRCGSRAIVTPWDPEGGWYRHCRGSRHEARLQMGSVTSFTWNGELGHYQSSKKGVDEHPNKTT